MPSDPSSLESSPMPRSARAATRVFLTITFTGSAALWIALAFLKGRPVAQLLLLLLMWTPGIAALVVRRTRHEPPDGLGWRLRRPGVTLVGYFIPLAYGAAAYGVLWATHTVGFAPAALPSLVPTAVGLSLAGIVSALGEELGWRGALVPLLARRMSFAGVALTSGAIWAAWHFPVFLLGIVDTHGVPMVPALALFSVIAIEAAFVTAWLRLASGSVWPSVLFHASHNVFVLHVLSSLTADPPRALRLAGETSVLLAGAIAVPAVVCWVLGVRLALPGNASPARRTGRAALPVPLAIVGLAIVLLSNPGQAQTADPTLWETNGSVNAMARSGSTIYIGGDFSAVRLQTGEGIPLDLSNGIRVCPYARVGGRADAVVYAVAPDGEGGWYIGGTFSTVGGLPRTNLARILADGSVADWNPGASSTVLTIAAKGHTVYVGGYFDIVGGRARRGLAAIDSRDGAVSLWDPRLDGSVTALAVQGHLIYVGGGFSSAGGEARSNIAALDGRTGDATDWNPGTNFGVLSLAIGENTIYAGGYFTRIGGRDRNCIAAIDARTGEVTDWNPNARSSDEWNPQFITAPWISALAVSDSTVYAGGHFETIGGQVRNAVAALDAKTGVATPWAPRLLSGYLPPFPFVLALAVSGSAVYVGGAFAIAGDQSCENFAAIEARTGNLRPSTVTMDLGVTGLAVQGSAVYVGGAFRRISKLQSSLAAFDADSRALSLWDPRASGNVNVLSISGTRVYVGGTFRTMGGKVRFSLAAVDAMTGSLLPWDARLANTHAVSRDYLPQIDAIATSGPRVYAGGEFDFAGPKAQNNLAALDSATALSLPWNPEPDGIVRALVAAGSKVYAAGDFRQIGDQPRNFIASLDAESAEATSWDPDASNPVLALAVEQNRILAGGEFLGIGGQPRDHIAALDSGCGAPTAWNPGADGPVDVLLADGGVLYTGGRFRNIGGQPRAYLAALDDALGTVLGWNPGPDDRVLALARMDAIVFAGGRFRAIGNVVRQGIAAIDAADELHQLALADVRPAAQSPSLRLDRVEPNPARSDARIRFTLPRAERVSLRVFDLQGRAIAIPLDRVRLSSGAYEVPLRTDAWPAGVYLYRLEAGSEAAMRKLVIVH